MSAARPVVRSLVSRRCLATPSTRPTAVTTTTTAAASSLAATPRCGLAAECRRALHGSAPLEARRKPRFKSVQAAKMGLTTPEKVEGFTRRKFPEYTEEDKRRLSEIYSPEQLEAIEAGERAVEARDLTVQGRLRRDPYRLGYVDDMSTLEPVIDKRARTRPAPDARARFMNPDEFAEDFASWLRSYVPKDVNLDGLSDSELSAALDKYAPSSLEILKYMTERSSVTDKGRGSNTALAPALMDKVPGVAGLYKRQADPEDEDLDETGEYRELKKQTGLTVREIIDLPYKDIVVRWVSNQTRLGKIRTTHVMCIVGNRDGRIGLGEAKSVDSPTAAKKARLLAIKNMVPIRRYEDRTIFGNVEKKISGTIVRMEARPPGFGLRVSHRIFEICRMAGIRDLSARIPRSRCPMNTVKAAIKCLQEQPDPEAIAIGRGRKLVDARKVYYGGTVH